MSVIRMRASLILKLALGSLVISGGSLAIAFLGFRQLEWLAGAGVLFGALVVLTGTVAYFTGSIVDDIKSGSKKQQ